MQSKGTGLLCELPETSALDAEVPGLIGIGTGNSEVSSGNLAWRFRGSHKWGYTSPSKGHKYSYPGYNPLVATHEPPSGRRRLGLSGLKVEGFEGLGLGFGDLGLLVVEGLGLLGLKVEGLGLGA